MSESTTQPQSTDLSAEASAKPEAELIAVRREKLAKLRSLGVDPFGARFETTVSPAGLKADFSDEKQVTTAGRIIALRDMGKSVFFSIGDAHGSIQCYLSVKALDETQAAIWKCLDRGDWVGVTGETFTTRTGEPTIKVDAFTVLSKSLRPMPDKFHGLSDRETKYRKRHLDLIGNPDSAALFITRSKMIAEMRNFLHARDFLEVETPMLQSVAGGAAARPFETHHNALGMPLTLRIAPELFLKRLLVGGFTKVFELNRNFRNEGISRRHNPEFTMLEAYWAYADFTQMADLVEEMVCHLAEKICGGLRIDHKDSEGNILRTIDLSRPWRRASYEDLLRGVEPKWYDFTSEERRAWCLEHKIDVTHCVADFEVTQHVFEKLVEEKTMNPLFVTHCPKELVPLAKQNAADPRLVDVYELVINGQEISPGYSELNDPDVQRERLEHQSGGETQKLDDDFLTALEYGMPPAGGIGIGIDRLVMMLAGVESIRDVILFPHMRPRSAAH
jgi:lysyl-tRNA synthetase class 2